MLESYSVLNWSALKILCATVVATTMPRSNMERRLVVAPSGEESPRRHDLSASDAQRNAGASVSELDLAVFIRVIMHGTRPAAWLDTLLDNGDEAACETRPPPPGCRSARDVVTCLRHLWRMW